jgi:phage terminase large subunit-like protein
VKDYCAIAAEYVRAVLADEIPACRNTKFACERARRDHARGDSWEFVFNPAEATRVCDFIECLRHTKSAVSTKGGEQIALLNFQVFALTEIFGWLRRGSGRRRFKRVWMEMGKGNGKSTLCAGIALYLGFCDREEGSDVLCTASVREQARIVLDTARQMAQQDAKLCRDLGLTVQANDILQPETQSRLRALSAKATSVEGVSLHGAILDEVHAQRGRELYDCLSTQTTKRGNSLFVMVTTAGNDSAGVAHELHQYAEDVLNQVAEADTDFILLYGTDPDDAWDSPLSWQKSNPAWGVSVDPATMQAEADRAKHMPSERQAFRVFHLSEWLLNGGDEAFLDYNRVRDCYDKALLEEPFKDQPAVFGADFANKVDLVSLVRVHVKKVGKRDHYYVFAKNWLPRQTLAESSVSQLRGWAETGQLIATPGGVHDTDAIEDTIMEEWNKCKVRDYTYDPAFASTITLHLKRRTDNPDAFVEATQFARSMTEGMNLLKELVVDGRLHTNSQVLLWCLGNLMFRCVGLNFLMPARPKDRSKKIDCAVALIMALKSAALCPLGESLTEENPYAKRGIIFLEGGAPWT